MTSNNRISHEFNAWALLGIIKTTLFLEVLYFLDLAEGVLAAHVVGVLAHETLEVGLGLVGVAHIELSVGVQVNEGGVVLSDAVLYLPEHLLGLAY